MKILIYTVFIFLSTMGLAQNKLSINVGGFADLVSTTKGNRFAIPQISLTYNDRIEIGGFLYNTSGEHHPDLIQFTENELNVSDRPHRDLIFNGYLKVYLGQDRKYSLSAGGYSKYLTKERIDYFSDYREIYKNAQGIPVMALTNELERIPLFTDVSIAYIGFGYNFEVLKNLYLEPELRFRRLGRVQSVYISDIGTPLDPKDIDNRYKVSKHDWNSTDLALSISLTYRIGLIKVK